MPWGVGPCGLTLKVLAIKASFPVVHADRTVGLQPVSQTGHMALIFFVPGAAVRAHTVGSGAKCCPPSFFMMCLYPSSSQTLWSSARQWPTLGKLSLLLLWMGPSRER